MTLRPGYRWIKPVVLLLTLIVLAACQRQPAALSPTATPDAAEGESPGAPTNETAQTPRDTPVRPTATPQATETPTATPEPVVKDLVVCLALEPDNLYLYSHRMVTKTTIQHAIYENLFTNLTYAYQAQGLDKLPSLVDGDAVVNSIAVAEGDVVLDSHGAVSRWQAGVRVMNSQGEEVPFDGEPVTMDQMVVRFTFKPLVWSDGTQVTAADSVYSFEVAADPDTPVSKFRSDRTASYVAEDDLTVVWRGVPGWRDTAYFTNVWAPLPRHQLQQYRAAELLEADETNRRPLSNGPFVVTEWVAGDQIQLTRNPHYYRNDEGLPHLTNLTFRFIRQADQLLSALLAGQCDVGTQDGLHVGQIPSLAAAEEEGVLRLHFQAGSVFEHIDFSVVPAEEYAETRPDWFGDGRVRQAITMCTDRQRMIDELLHGRSQIMHAYVPPVHPLHPDDLSQWAYDVAAANALLDEAGFVDSDGDGIRQYPGAGVPFQVTLGTASGGELRPQVNRIFQESLAACGIAVELYEAPAGQWFASGPAGPLFGRRFDLATFAWGIDVVPPCHLYLSEAIPGPPDTQPAGWDGRNVTGWSNPEFDAACEAARNAFPGTAEYVENHQAAMRIFADNVPIIPLFAHVKMAVTAPDILNLNLDPSQTSELWNIHEIDRD